MGVPKMLWAVSRDELRLHSLWLFTDVAREREVTSSTPNRMVQRVQAASNSDHLKRRRVDITDKRTHPLGGAPENVVRTFTERGA